MRTCRIAAPRAGLTLVDLVIALLVLGVMSAVAAPRFAQMLGRYRVESAAGRVRADLEYARQQARTHGQSRTIVFDPKTHVYELADMDHPDRPGAKYVVNLSESPGGVSLESATFGGGNSPNVTFDLYGRADGSGTVVLSAGAWQRSVRVDGTTGRVTIE
jgi:Tfp pilus assembly protein PilE